MLRIYQLNVAFSKSTASAYITIMLPADSKLIGQFFRFAAVGAIGTMLHYTVLLVLVELFSVGAVVSSMTGATGGAVVNYLLNYYYTFESNRAHLLAAPSFMFIAASGLLLNGILMYFLVHVISMHYLISQIIATGMVLCWNFVLNRNLTFRE